MYNSRICLFVSLLLTLIFTQSCSDDFDFASDENFTNNSNNQEDRSEDQRNRGNTLDISAEWMDLFLELDRYATGMRPTATARAIAYINLAAYETIIPNSNRFTSNQEFLDGLEIEYNIDERNLDNNIALNKTYSIVMDRFLPTLSEEKRGLIEEKYNEMVRERRNREDSRFREESEEWGEYVASQVIAYAQSDLSAEEQIISPQPLSYIPPTGIGYWTFSAEPERALFPYWSEVRTFVVDVEQTTSLPPLEYSTDSNSPYYQEMMEVYQENNKAKDEDGEQLWIAEFWSDDVENLMFSPPARQISIATQVIEQKRLRLEEALYLYLKVGFAMNDAAVASWKYKYDYMVMRPSVYIQDYIDASYQTNLYTLIPWPNPTFPAYPSGHSTFASAAAGVFIQEFGDEIDFTDESHKGRIEFRGTPRSYGSFSTMAYENAFSRIPLGVHMRMDCVEGLRLGYEISDGVNTYELRKQEL